jgi:hypothetical protein
LHENATIKGQSKLAEDAGEDRRCVTAPASSAAFSLSGEAACSDEQAGFAFPIRFVPSIRNCGELHGNWTIHQFLYGFNAGEDRRICNPI